MNNRLRKFEEALTRAQVAFKKTNFLPLEWIIDQLRYLIAVERGETYDFSALEKIKIGWIAAREMDGYEDKDFIKLLCSISLEAEQMLKEKKLIIKQQKNQ